MLQQFFFQFYSNIEYFSFLHSTKSDLLAVIKLRQQKINYLTKETTDEEEETSKKFIAYALEKKIPIITTVTINLLKNYHTKLNEEEALQKATALLKNKNTRSATAEVATILTSETSIEPAYI